MTTILHTADVHLDRTYSGVGMTPAIASARRQELRHAFRRFVDLALEMNVNAVTIGGDLYEHERVTADTGNFIRSQLERLGETLVLIAPGNHDPYVSGSLYERMSWPPNVTIFRGPEFTQREIAPDLTIWGAGHDAPDLRHNLLQEFRVPESGTHVLLFHGSDMQSVPEGKSAHAPFSLEDIEATGAAFALLGHYHGARLHPQAATRFVYPGTPEPLDFAEEGDHFVARLDIDAGQTTCTLLPFGTVRYETHSVDVTGMESSDDIRMAIESRDQSGLIARIVLTGDLHPDVDLSVRDLYNACAERFAYLDIHDRTQPAYKIDELADESTTKGAFVRLMLAQIEAAEGGNRAAAEQALVYGLQAFDRREVSIR